MSKKILVIAAVAMGCMQINAQDLTIKSNTKIEGLPEEYAAFGESEKVVYLKGDKTKTESTSMMGNQLEFYDGKTMTMLMESMGNKSGWTATKEELEAGGKDDKKDENKPKFEKTTEKKTIAGYECVKTVVTLIDPKDKKELKVTIWSTDKIKKPSASKKPSKSDMQRGNFDFEEIGGFPMLVEFTANNNGMDIHFIETVTEVITTAIEDGVFKPNTDGYKMMTYKEMKEQRKAMEGGEH